MTLKWDKAMLLREFVVPQISVLFQRVDRSMFVPVKTLIVKTFISFFIFVE